MKHIQSSIKHLLAACICFSALLFTGCDDGKEITIDTYIRVDVANFTFDSEGERTVTININTEGSGWSYTINYATGSEGDWLSEVSATSSSLTIGATANTETSLRSGSITITNENGAKKSIPLNQSFTLPPAPSMLTLLSKTIRVSPNGTYISYFDSGYTEGVYWCTPITINLKNGDVTVFNSIEFSMNNQGVSDTGVLIGYNSTSQISHIYYPGSGDPYVLGSSGPAEIGGKLFGAVQGISSDGKIIVGYIKGTGLQEKYLPCKWTGDRTSGLTLKILQTPDTHAFGGLNQTGTMARGCSADGSVIYGTDWQSPYFVPVVWKDEVWSYMKEELCSVEIGNVQMTQAGMTFNIPNQNIYSYPLLYASYTQLSPNGRYLACHYMKVIDAGIGPSYLDPSVMLELKTTKQYPLYCDLQTGTYYVAEGSPTGYGNAVTNEGIFFYVHTDGNGYVRANDRDEILTSWIKGKSGLIIPDGSKISYVTQNRDVLIGNKPIVIGGMSFTLDWAMYHNESLF